MEFVSTSSRVLGLRGYQVLPSGRKEVVWDNYESKDYHLLQALPIAEAGSDRRYRIFPANAELTLVESGDEYHLAVWEVSMEPIAILKGFHSEMKDIEKLEALSGQALEDINAWLDKLDLD